MFGSRNKCANCLQNALSWATQEFLHAIQGWSANKGVYMRKRPIVLLGFALFVGCQVFSLPADPHQPVFVFAGNELYVGMPQHDALTALSRCCKLTPRAEFEIE